MNYLKKIFFLPSFTDDFETYSARMLRVIMVFLTIVGFIYTITNIFNAPQNSLRFILQFASILATSGTMYLLVHIQRRPQLAAITLVLFAWVIFTIAAYTGGGIISSAYMGYLVVLVITGLISTRLTLTIIITVLCIASGYILIYLEQNGLLPISRVENSIQNIWLDSIIYFMLVAGLQILAARIVREALRRVHQENQQKQQAEQNLNTTINAAHLATWQANLKTGEKIYSKQYLEFNDGFALAEDFANVHPEDREAVIRTITNAAQGKIDEFSLSHRIISPSGKTRWIESWGRISRDNQGQPEIMAGLAQDVTDKKHTEQRQKKRSELLTKVIEIGKEVTQTNNIDSCTKKIHESIQEGLQFDRVGLFLYDENQQVIRGAYGTNQQGEIEDTSWFVQKAQEYEPWQIALRDPDGASIIKNYQEIHDILPIDNEVAQVKEYVTLAAWSGLHPVALITVDNVFTNRPITDEKIEALRLFAGYAGLAITNARHLEAINNELESFSYSVSHDLRSPLRAIVGFSQILMTDFEQTFDANSYKYLQKIHQNGQKMGILIDDLLNFSRVGRQTLRIAKINLTPIVTNIAKELNSKNPDRKIIWKINELPACHADYNLVQQVLVNLIENAYKYTSTTTEPEIEIGSTKQGKKVIYFVRDNGIGFDIKYTDKIFGVFQRLHHDTEFEGTGVGLATVQRIIERHNGKIWAESETGKGATFYFTIP